MVLRSTCSEPLGLLLQSVLIDPWQKDLTEDGVFKGDGNGGRHPVCTMDIENAEWSGNTFLNSCTEPLSLHIQEALTAQGQDLNGLVWTTSVQPDYEQVLPTFLCHSQEGTSLVGSHGSQEVSR